MTLMDSALAYARRGWPVFPVEPHGKVPIGRLAPHGLKDATTDESVIARWWKAEPEANIGMPTGIVFDAGDFDSDEAIGRFAAIAKEHDVDLKAFPRARTGRGRHLLVAPTGIGNKVDVIPGMDWRGKGGYVLLPDSVHINGSTYEWVKEPTDDLPAAPPWVIELLNPTPAPARATPAAPSPKPSAAYLQSALDAELGELRRSGPGKRNDTLNRASFALGQMIAAGWITRGYAEDALLAASIANGLADDDGEKGVRATIKSGLTAGAKEPRQAPDLRATSITARQHAGPQVAPGGLQRPQVTPKIYSAAALEHMDIPEPRPVVPGLIHVGLNMLAGKGKLGKSWLALDVAIKLARGGSVLDSIEVEPAEVLYMALEDNPRRMKERIRLLLHHTGDRKWPDRLHVSHDWPKLDEGGIQAIDGWLEENPAAKLVIIDVWKRLRHARQKGAQLYDEDYDHLIPLQAIALRRDVAVLVIHHTRKSGAEDVTDEISGTGGILAALDTCIILHRTRSEADGEIWVTGRDVEDAHLALRFDAGNWTLMGPANEVARSSERGKILAVIAAAGPAGMTPIQVAEALGKPRPTTKQTMWRMFMDKELEKGIAGAYVAPERDKDDSGVTGRVTGKSPILPGNTPGNTVTARTRSVTGTAGNSVTAHGASVLKNGVSGYRVTEAENASSLSLLPVTGLPLRPLGSEGEKESEVVTGNTSETRPRARTPAREGACPTCGSPTRLRPTVNQDLPWCDACGGWAGDKAASS